MWGLHQESEHPLRLSREARASCSLPEVPDFDGGRACATSYGRGLHAGHGASRSYGDFVAAVSGPDSIGLSYGESGGCSGFFRKRLKLSDLIEGVGKEGKAFDRFVQQEGGLHAEGGPKCFQKDEALRTSSSYLGRFCRWKGPVHEVPREAWRLLRSSRHGPGDVAFGKHSRFDGAVRFCRSQRADGVDSSQCRADGSRWPKMGCGLASLPTGRSSSGNVQQPPSFNESQTEGFLSSMPARLGSHHSELCQGSRHHKQSEAGGTTRTKGAPSKHFKATRSKRSEPKAKAAEVPEEAKEDGGGQYWIGVDRQRPSSSSIHSSPSGRPDVTIRSPCSEAPPCRTSACPSSSLPTWESLQTFSFHEWCSTLYSKVVNSKTPFAQFVKNTCLVVRASSYASEKSLFPIPVPKCGIFSAEKVGSRQRKRRHFDRALHIVIMALNYWHANFKFVPVDALAKIPSAAQMNVLRNVRNLVRAFGSQQEPFAVPASGRRQTSLVAMLADLSDFVTWEGLSGDSYLHGFPGAEKDAGHCGVHVPSRNDRAPELLPYRALDPARLKLSGSAAWDPTPYLSDILWLAYVEPSSLLWSDEMPPLGGYPNLDDEKYEAVRDLALLWDSRGLLRLTEIAPSSSWTFGAMRFFNCYKSLTADRMIGDRRLRNWREGRIPGVSRYLPTAMSLAALEIDPKEEKFSICIADRRDFYHQFQVSSSRSSSNAVWPPLRVEDVISTKAFSLWKEDLAVNKKYDRVVHGDQLAQPRRKTRVQNPEKLLACFSSIPQGDHLGVEFATEAHRNLLIANGLLPKKEEVRANCPFEGTKSAQGLVIDDYYAISVEARRPSVPICSSSSKAFRKAKGIYRSEGLLGSDDKDVVDQDKAKVTGAEIDSSDYVAGLGIASLGSPAKKRMALAFVSLELCSLRWTTDALHACLLGGWTHSLLYRRPRMSILQEAYKLCPLSDLVQQNPRLVALPRKVAEELVILSVLAPLMVTDLSSSFGEKIYATDASDAKGAIVSRTLSPHVARALWRTGRKKGGYIRMLSRQEALIQKINEMKEFPLNASCEAESVDRPMAYRFHFLEVCGGAGKITREMSALGWTCGPVLDLEASMHYDLSALRLLQWIFALLEEGRLDAFIVEPPCTTFSPAQYPASRSYDEPRGFDPEDPKTLKGTTLALRALALMNLGATLRTPCLLEQPRKSKMRKLAEWAYLLSVGLAYEEWLASCMYGSPHKKEFVFLAAAIDVRAIHMKCSGDHDHIPIQGSYAKPSATYTDALAAALASCFDKALARKIRCENHLKVKTEGLETPLCNDVLVSGSWSVDDVWKWRKPGHINIREISSASRLLHSLALSAPKTRQIIVMDSNVGLSALVKGRSPSYGLQKALRRSGAAIVGGCLYPAFIFGPTRIIPADHPTRDHEIPRPSKSLADNIQDFDSVLELAKVQGLSRQAANWIRLVLLVLGGRLPWWASTDSWRFAHLGYKHYPFLKVISQGDCYDFDSTKGFPGEGPMHAFGFGFWISKHLWSLDFHSPFELLHSFGLGLWTSRFSCRRLLSCLSCVLCGAALAWFCECVPRQCGGSPPSSVLLHSGVGWSGFSSSPLVCVQNPSLSLVATVDFISKAVQEALSLTLFCGFLRGTRSKILGCFWGKMIFGVVWFSAIPTDAASHGFLLPRDSADRARAFNRAPSDLPAGRPVLGQTQKHRDKLLEAFAVWLQAEGFNLDELLGVGSLDVETINLLLERYGRALYKAGRPYGHFAETINGVVGRRPTLRRQMQQSWDLAFAWLRQEPPVHHVALPWQVLLSLISTCLAWGWRTVAGVLAMSWGGLTRIGEVFAGTRRNLILPRDVGFTTSFVLLEIMEPKTRFRAARHQVAKVDQIQLVEVIDLAFKDLLPGQKLWPFSPQTMRTRFKRLLQALGLDQIPSDLKRGLDLGSLRAGGATWLLMESEDSELTRRRGRWVSNKVMEVYVQEAGAIQFLPRLPEQIRKQILRGAYRFPWCLHLATRLSSAEVPLAVWYLIFQKEAAELEVSNGCFLKEEMGAGNVKLQALNGLVKIPASKVGKESAMSDWTVDCVTVTSRWQMLKLPTAPHPAASFCAGNVKLQALNGLVKIPASKVGKESAMSDWTVIFFQNLKRKNFAGFFESLWKKMRDVFLRVLCLVSSL